VAERRLRASKAFLKDVESLGLTGGDRASAQLAWVLSSLRVEATLPAPSDEEALLPPLLWFYARELPGLGLWLWYDLRGKDREELRLIRLTQTIATKRPLRR
jgi:hypothetical protein